MQKAENGFYSKHKYLLKIKKSSSRYPWNAISVTSFKNAVVVKVVFWKQILKMNREIDPIGEIIIIIIIKLLAAKSSPTMITSTDIIRRATPEIFTQFRTSRLLQAVQPVSATAGKWLFSAILPYYHWQNGDQ